DQPLDRIIEGEIPRGGGLWILLGEKAFHRLGLRVGEIITLGSPSSTSILTLQVTGVYRTGGLRDYEALVPLEIGVELGSLPRGTISAIRVGGINGKELGSLLRTLYNLTLIHEAGRGEIIILDSLNAPVASFKMEGRSHTLLLPFGYYTVIYRESYLTADLSSFLLRENLTITLGVPGKESYRLMVVAPKADHLTLTREDGLSIQGRLEGDTWVFDAPLGLYTLMMDGGSYLVPLLGDTTFNPSHPQVAMERVVVRVQWQDGRGVTDYLISLRSADGVLVSSMRSLSPEASINLPPGEYEAEVSKPPYTSRVRFKVPGEEVWVVLPSVSNPGRITPSLFQQLKAVTPIEASTATLTSLTGITTSSITALALSLAILSMIAVFTVQRGLYKSAEDNLQVLTILGAGRKSFLKIIWIKLLGLNIALGLASAYSTLRIHEFLSSKIQLSVLGYGIEPDPPLALIYSLTLCIVSWLLLLARLPSEAEV
ncbi:MAG: hypothetical protein QXH67_07360, partial [Candidatus Bathyarchaeia archaeon]